MTPICADQVAGCDRVIYLVKLTNHPVVKAWILLYQPCNHHTLGEVTSLNQLPAFHQTPGQLTCQAV